MIEPRTVSVTVEINNTDYSMSDIKRIVKKAIIEEMIGQVRTVQVNVIQGSRKKKGKK